MNLGIYCPLHITSVEDIYHANQQARFFLRCKQDLCALPIFTLDKDKTGCFDRLWRSQGSVFLDLRDKPCTGIVDPTVVALDYIKDHCDVFMRITQDTQVINFGLFEAHLKMLTGEYIVGGMDECDNITNYLRSIGVEKKPGPYKFVQGNMIISNMSLWQRFYKALPKAVKHYCDDSIFSYLVEHQGGVKPSFVVNKFWDHNRTKDVYYLESLYPVVRSDPQFVVKRG